MKKVCIKKILCDSLSILNSLEWGRDIKVNFVRQLLLEY